MNENGYTENDYELALIDLFQSLEGKQYRYNTPCQPLCDGIIL